MTFLVSFVGTSSFYASSCAKHIIACRRRTARPSPGVPRSSAPASLACRRLPIPPVEGGKRDKGKPSFRSAFTTCTPGCRRGCPGCRRST
eukprot:6311874-Pyramimonas_sp.AAC.1